MLAMVKKVGGKKRRKISKEEVWFYDNREIQNVMYI